MRPIPDLKQEIMRINNRLNIEMFGMGLRRQRVIFAENTVFIIIADNKRVPALASLDSNKRQETRLIDIALLNGFKDKLKVELEELLNLEIKCIFKDYLPEEELAATIVLLQDGFNIKEIK